MGSGGNVRACENALGAAATTAVEAAPVLAYSDNDALGAPTRPGCAGKPQPGSVPCSGSEQAWGRVRRANKRNGFSAPLARREGTGMGGSVDRAV